ncbi:MAG: hypothetical protein HW387_1531 [Parachlamydiales bacterium]|nr:hypothetical protein [Parachlamydiales bacterium]
MPWWVNNGVRFSNASPRSDECSICKNTLEKDVVGHLTHLFHATCIGKWFAAQRKHEGSQPSSIWGRVFSAKKESSSCPLCFARVVNAVDFIPPSETRGESYIISEDTFIAALEGAAQNGHLAVIEGLFKNCSYRIPSHAIIGAVQIANDHPDVVLLLQQELVNRGISGVQ